MTRPAVALLLALPTLAACSRTPARAPTATSKPDGRRHVVIVRVVTTGARRATFDELARRNPGSPSWVWEGPEQVDDFAGHLRRARRDLPRRPGRGTPEEEARAAALSVEALDALMTGFLQANGDLLGIPTRELPKLQIDVDDFHHHGALQFEPASRRVRAHGTIPMRGFLAFPELASHVSIVAAFDGDGRVLGFEQESEIHPRINLTVDPLLGPDDPRVLAKVIGRRLFALVPSGKAPDEPTRTRASTRLELGKVLAEDVRAVRPDIHIAAGPLGSYRSYRLVYRVDVAKARPPTSFPSPGPGGFFFFTWRVDPDTGDVVEDPQVPIASADRDESDEGAP